MLPPASALEAKDGQILSSQRSTRHSQEYCDRTGRHARVESLSLPVMVFNVLLSLQPWKPPSSAMRRLCELQTVHAGILRNRAEWQDRLASGLGDSTATHLAAMTIDHFTTQLAAIDRVICETIDQDAELRSRRDLLLSFTGGGETLSGVLDGDAGARGSAAQWPDRRLAGLIPSHYRFGSSIDRPTRISKIGNAALRSAFYMPALSAMRFNPAIAALVARLKVAARLGDGGADAHTGGFAALRLRRRAA